MQAKYEEMCLAVFVKARTARMKQIKKALFKGKTITQPVFVEQFEVNLRRVLAMRSKWCWVVPWEASVHSASVVSSLLTCCPVLHTVYEACCALSMRPAAHCL